MKIAIIGAGPGGLAAIRHCLEEGHECVAYEKNDKIGGTWVYNPKTGLDTNGLPIHTSMYDGLRTNVPKELMCYENFPYTKPNHSFLTHEEVLEYINDFAEAFNLLQHIKFLRHVVNVTSLPNNRWKLKVENLSTKNVLEIEFDAVIVCVGNYSVPYTPKFQGIEAFEGTVIHSHDYRTIEPYKHKKVLIIGSGPSAIDISSILSDKCDKLFMSFRGQLQTVPDDKTFTKPIVKSFKERSVVFSDGSEEDIDSVIVCTGYLLSYPFLTPECGIEVEDNWVKYLYKYIINVKRPTMAFIAITSEILSFPVFGIQIRYFLAYLRGDFHVTQKEMMNDIMADVQEKEDNNIPMRYYRRVGLGPILWKYMSELADQAGIKPVPPVICKLHRYHLVANGDRTCVYKIIDDEEFIRLDNH